jgi:nicotinate-nucleotide adenylyltransferase
LTPRRRPRYRPIRLSAAPVDEPDRPGRRRSRRVGLFGGSFNPAHEGHLHVSLIALKTLNLDELWWLVSPQNPLKPRVGMAPFEDRVAGARRLAQDRRIKVSTLEADLGLHFTADTVRALKRRHPRIRFVWLMGADNLPGFTHWRRWAEIYRAVPVAIFDRRPYAPQVHSTVPSIRFARHHLPERLSRRLAELTPPVWTFLHSRLHAASASAIRAARLTARRR